MISKKLLRKIILRNNFLHRYFSVMYPEGFSYWYTVMSAHILAPEKENIFWFTAIFSITAMFFLLDVCQICFQVRKYILSIVNYCKAKNMCIVKGFYTIDDHQHFNMDLLSVLHYPLNNLLCR